MKGETKCNEQKYYILYQNKNNKNIVCFHFNPIKCTIFLKQTNKQTNKLLYNETHFNNTYPCIFYILQSVWVLQCDQISLNQLTVGTAYANVLGMVAVVVAPG